MLKEVQVTKTYLPDKKEYLKYVDKIWESGWLTNNGALSMELENQLKKKLKVSYLKFVSSGTTALQLAIHALELTGEIITTPYSYVATTSAILWQNCKPVFVDIETDSFNIDVSLIEEKITSETSAILATHVYGIPCAVEKIELLAKKHNLKVIYDAAHCFGVEVDGKSIFEFGDTSICSFHSTKIFHTIEGGAVISKTEEIDKKIFLNRAFGHIGDIHSMLGINGKNSEFHAAMGLCNLPGIQERISERKKIFENYSKRLEGLPISILELKKNINYNYSYFPVVFKSHKEMTKVKTNLENKKIYPRRYFFPSLNKIDYLEYQSCPRSESIAERVLCLPYYDGLEDSTVKIISETIKNVIQDG